MPTSCLILCGQTQWIYYSIYFTYYVVIRRTAFCLLRLLHFAWYISRCTKADLSFASISLMIPRGSCQLGLRSWVIATAKTVYDHRSSICGKRREPWDKSWLNNVIDLQWAIYLTGSIDMRNKVALSRKCAHSLEGPFKSVNKTDTFYSGTPWIPLIWNHREYRFTLLSGLSYTDCSTSV